MTWYEKLITGVISVIVAVGVLVLFIILITPEEHTLKQPNYWQCKFLDGNADYNSTNCFQDIDDACTTVCHNLSYTWTAECDYYKCQCWHWYNIRIKGINC